MFYVYKIRNKINNKVYIGKRKSKNPYIDSYMGSGKLIKSAILKYGKENFTKTILKTFGNDTDASYYEKKIVTKRFCDSKNTYNLHEGGEGGFHHVNNIPLNSRPNIIKVKEMFKEGEISSGSVYWSDEGREKVIRQAQHNIESGKCTTKGMKFTEDHKKKISEKMTGTQNPQYGKHWYINEKGHKIMGFEKDIPDGYEKMKDIREEKKNKKNPQYGKRWYNDGNKNYLLYPNDEKTSTLVLGRL